VAECTDLPGCLSEGETFEGAMENISEAIIGCSKSRQRLLEKISRIRPSTKSSMSLRCNRNG
jgi:predicted RNase H-like HicB family nuclease